MDEPNGQVQINLVRPKLFWTDQNCFGHIEGQGISVTVTISTQFPAIGDDSQTTMIGLDLRKASREKTLTVQRTKQNQSYDSGERSKKYHEEKQKKKSKTVKQNNSNII